MCNDDGDDIYMHEIWAHEARCWEHPKKNPPELYPGLMIQSRPCRPSNDDENFDDDDKDNDNDDNNLLSNKVGGGSEVMYWHLRVVHHVRCFFHSDHSDERFWQ